MQNKIIEYNIDKILNHVNQPRKTYSQESIIDLAKSIKQFGLLQPIVLSSKHLPFRIIAGQRRLLAYKYLRDNVDNNKYSKIQAITKDDTSDSQNLYLALIENLQRVDLNVIDKAESFKTLIDNGFARTHKEIANSLGLSVTLVSKTIKISELAYNAKKIAIENNYSNILVLEKLVNIETSDELLKEIISKEMSRKDALRFISEKNNQLQKADKKLKKIKNNLLKGSWGRIEITSKQTHLHLTPNKLDKNGQILLDKLIKLLDGSTQDIS